ncbi:MAG: hypothetical protein MUF01_03690 [Bryobacterales bacterium]|jgi:hypothetical protein|nr:hypothetical protein [Bryobacterales bacterium]
MSTHPHIHPAAQREIDDTHLRYLSIANYIYAAFNAVGALVAVGMVMLLAGSAAVGGFPFRAPEVPGGGAFFVLIAAVVLVFMFCNTALQFLLARCLQQRRAHAFCFVVAILTALNMPVGTILGVLTLVVLMRPTVKHQFDEEQRRRDGLDIAAALG